MKRLFSVMAAGVVIIAAAAGCKSNAQKVTAVVGCKDAAPVALVVEYAEPIVAASVTPDAFTVPGHEIAAVMVSDINPAAKPESSKNSDSDKIIRIIVFVFIPIAIKMPISLIRFITITR